MSKAFSFERINYSLRPNKSAERKIIIETLSNLKSAYDIAGYRYIGFGSLWFTDLVLAHKLLGIDHLISIERASSKKKRIEFNKPLGCIEIVMGSSTEQLEKIVDDEKKTLTWLDYDGDLISTINSGDIEIFCEKAAAGSILIITVNADTNSLKYKKEGEKELTETEYLERNLMHDLPKDFKRYISRSEFPKLAANIVFRSIESSLITSDRNLEFKPLWNIKYSDNANMVTVGGVIDAKEELDRLEDIPFLKNPPDYISLGKQQFGLNLPILTMKEKMHLDSLLPSETTLSPADLDFELKAKELDAYSSLYKFFPTFSEIT
ncbi:O-methyltransferase [Marinobacter salarius]|uniref:O-methyltransferase n=1 Tax=Marinobacter salarius TaxID=1420917 RepID=UPI00300ADB59